MLSTLLKSTSETDDPLDFAYVDRQLESSSSSSATRTISVSLGTANSTRRIYCLATWPRTSTLALTRVLNSATIAGVSATIFHQNRVSPVGGHAFFAANVPTGTTGNIVLNLSGTTESRQARVFVFSSYNHVSDIASQYIGVGSALTSDGTASTGHTVGSGLSFEKNGVAWVGTHQQLGTVTTTTTFTSNQISLTRQISTATTDNTAWGLISAATTTATFTTSWASNSTGNRTTVISLRK
jgi:hypothetical protein